MSRTLGIPADVQIKRASAPWGQEAGFAWKGYLDMKWENLVLRVVANALKQPRKSPTRVARQSLKRVRRDEGLRLKQAYLARRVSLDAEMGSLTAEEFEAFVAALFELEGWRASLTARSSDMGIDINLSRASDGKRAVVQCKKYAGTVGQPAIRDLFGVMNHVPVAEGYLVTTGHFSAAALAFAQGKAIHLIDGEALLSWVRRQRPCEAAAVALYDRDSASSEGHSRTARFSESVDLESRVFISDRSKAFLTEVVDGFAGVRELIHHIQAPPESSCPDSTRSLPSARRVARLANNHSRTLRSAVNSLHHLLRTGVATYSEKTPLQEIRRTFDEIAELLREIGARYAELRLIAAGRPDMPRALHVLVECYDALFADVEELFASAEYPGRTFLESPSRALAAGIARRDPEGGFRFTGPGLVTDLPRATAATNKLAEQLRLVE